MSQSSRSESQQEQAHWSDAELASALFDDELEGSEPALRQRFQSPQLRESFDVYAEISDALHPGGLQSVSPDFQSKVMLAILREPVHFLPAQRREVRQRRRILSAIAAGVGAVGFVSAAYFVALPGLEADTAPVVAQIPASGSGLAPVGSQAVQVQSPWLDAQARRYMDAHGPTVVKMRLEPEQP